MLCTFSVSAFLFCLLVNHMTSHHSDSVNLFIFISVKFLSLPMTLCFAAYNFDNIAELQFDGDYMCIFFT